MKLTLQFRGREMEFQQIGREMFQVCASVFFFTTFLIGRGGPADWAGGGPGGRGAPALHAVLPRLALGRAAWEGGSRTRQAPLPPQQCSFRTRLPAALAVLLCMLPAAAAPRGSAAWQAGPGGAAAVPVLPFWARAWPFLGPSPGQPRSAADGQQCARPSLPVALPFTLHLCRPPLQRFVEDCGPGTAIEQAAQMQGRQMSMVLAPPKKEV